VAQCTNKLYQVFQLLATTTANNKDEGSAGFAGNTSSANASACCVPDAVMRQFAALLGRRSDERGTTADAVGAAIDSDYSSEDEI
jgi:hypothetical protein